MKPGKKAPETFPWYERSAKSVLEQAFIEEYLDSKGYCYDDLKTLPPEESRKLMQEACRYASIKMTEIEARAGYRQIVREL